MNKKRMTNDRMQLSELIEKAGADDFVREMLNFVAQRMMELDVEGRCGAGHSERSEERSNMGNCYRDRPWETVSHPLEKDRLCAAHVQFVRPQFFYRGAPRLLY